MSSLPVNQPVPELTPEQQGVFYDLLRTNVPTWLLAASETLRRQLHESLIASHRSRDEVAIFVRRLQSPEAFCAPLLAKAMSDKLGKPLDVAGVIFQHVRSTSSLLGLRKKLVLPIDRDLLTAACENFELSETLAGNYTDTSLIYIPEKITGRAASILSIEPHEFALLCRALDLGKQYQSHLQGVFNPASAINAFRDKYVAHATNSFEVTRHLALMKQHISVELHQALSAVKSQQPIKLGNNTLNYQALKILDVTIDGAIFIGPVSEHDDGDYRCVVYLPDDPLHPLKEYSSFSLFEVQLSARLRIPAFRKFFMRYIKLGDRAAFLQALDKRLVRPPGSLLPSSNVYVSVSGTDIQGHPFQESFRQYSQQVLADARLLVVPTDDEDEKSRLKRLETYQSIGINMVLLGASFVPVVGEILTAVTVMQLLSEVYEGIASWSRGEQEQATDYLFDTVENLVLMAAFAAGTAAVGQAYKIIRTSVFIEGLRKVIVANGSGRLWNPDLAAYHQPRLLPQALAPDARGLRWVDGQAYLPVDDRVLAVRPQTGTDLWEVLPPLSAGDEYTPLLETNDAGAWRHDSELVQQWSRLKLFRRFGYSSDDFPDATAEQILAVCAIHDNVLRQAHVDRSRPPALLVDTVRRFRADAAVTAFIEQINQPASASLADPDLQLHLLTTSSRWPGNAAIKVVDFAGRQSGFHGATTAQASHTVVLQQDALLQGQLHSSLLSALSRAQREALLGTATTDVQAQIKALTKVIADQAESHRVALFQRIYQRSGAPANTRAAVLMQRFVGLPAAVADELVRHAEAGEWDDLDADKVPLRLAEEAQRYLQVVRVSRAYEGLYLNAAGGLYTDRLVLDTLEHLPGWTDNVWVQIGEASGDQAESASIGSAQASEKIQVSALADRYSVWVDNLTASTTFAKRTREHYFQALWHGLSARRKTALGVDVDDAGAALRQKITELALTRRATNARIMDAIPLRMSYASPMGLADRGPASAVPGFSRPLVVQNSQDVLVRRALELYPMHSPTQIHTLVSALGSNVILVLQKLEAMSREFQGLRHGLSLWVNRQTWHQAPEGPRLEVPRLSKFRTAQAILRCWRNEPGLAQHGEVLGHTLRFDAVPLGELPVIIADFAHVGRLMMDGVGPSAGLNSFLRNFANLRSLSLRSNHLTRLPLALSDMSRLAHLDMSDNLIQLTPESLTQLADMSSLQSLNLAFNPHLTRAPDVSKLQRLEQLNLQGTGITQCPQGASSLPRLRELDLRDNQIATLPPEVFQASPLPNKGTNLHGNPLSPDTLQKVVAHQQRTGVSLGIIASEYRRPSVPITTDALSSLWLEGMTQADANAKRVLWESLRASADSRDFFNVLARLTGTADYTRLYSHFIQRVWTVLEAAAVDDRLRRSLFRLARAARFSVDGYSALFNEMEVQVLYYRAMASATAGAGSLEQQLMTLLRGLFRLHEIEAIALADINSRAASPSANHQHALEISLAYRVGLAARLDLPAQPRAMVSPLNHGVTAALLDQAYQKVLTTERSSSLLEWVITQRVWVEYLEATYQERFLEVTDRTARSFARLEGETGLSRAVATERMNAIVENFRNERRALISQLTSQALLHHRAPDIAGSSSGSEASR